MSKIIGIDLGTTNSAVAIVDSGFPIVIADPSGSRITPSVVSFEKGEILVGKKAKQGQSSFPKSTIYSVKQHLGRRYVDHKRRARSVDYSVREAKGGGVEMLCDGEAFSPEQVSAEILKRLKDIAERALGERIDRAVIAVPAYYNDAQRGATIEAGRLAGLDVERIINEPTAAALAYGLDKLDERSKIAVYDLGGGTFDLSILELTKGTFQVLATHGNTQLGGDDIDRALFDRLLSEIAFRSKYDRASLDESSLSKIAEIAEFTKIALTEKEVFEVSFPFLCDDLKFDFTRKDLDKLAFPIIEKTRSHCRMALKDAGLHARDLDQVILVGGQTRMPLLRRLVAKWFECSIDENENHDHEIGKFEDHEIEDHKVGNDHREIGNCENENDHYDHHDHHEIEDHEIDDHQKIRRSFARPILNVSQHPDEAIALGAAIQAAILEGEFKDLLLLDVTPLSLGIETFGGLMNVIIPRNSTLPTKAGETFTTAVDGQEKMLIHLLQGEREMAKDNWSLGQLVLDFEAAPRGIPRVGVQFEIDENGILQVLVRDIKTGKEEIRKVASAVNVDDSDVQKMVEESVEHAFEDLEARRWIENSLKAKAIIKATKQGIETCAKAISDEYRSQLEDAIVEIERCIKVENEVVGDSKKLIEMIKSMDELTFDLAELQMQQTMSELLDKKISRSY